MMMVAFLMGGWLIDARAPAAALAEDYAADMVAAAVIGGIIGAKLWYVALTRDPGALFSRGGLVWYGGFIGGALAVILNGWRLRVPLRWTMQLVGAGAGGGLRAGPGRLLPGQRRLRPAQQPALGREVPRRACRRRPPATCSTLFGVPVPAGIDPSTVLAVHPTQLYETALMLGAFFVLWALAAARPADRLAVRRVPGVRRGRAVPGRDPARQGRPVSGPVHPGAAHQSVILVAIGACCLTLWRRGAEPGPGRLSARLARSRRRQRLDSLRKLVATQRR